MPVAFGIDARFFPDGTRARLMDAKAHALLGDSLEHIRQQASPVVPAVAGLSALTACVRAGEHFGPASFGRYYRLAGALLDDRLDEAGSIAGHLSQATPAAPGLDCVALDDLPDADVGLYHEMMDTDPHTSFAMLPPTADLAAGFRVRYNQAFGRLQAAMPTLADEISGLIRQLCMVAGDDQASCRFDGGSSYMLWGALFLNIASHETDVELIEVLAHESAHCLLFGHSLDEPLVLNDDAELFASPLRSDPRPMDGIYHATFVSARMHWAMSQLLEGASLSAVEREHAERERHRDAENFWAGHDVVGRDGILSATGHAVMDEARRYMVACS